MARHPSVFVIERNHTACGTVGAAAPTCMAS